MRILIAEDEAVIAESLYQVLLELGHQPLDPVGSFTEAIELLAQNKPDLAIVDIHIGERYSGFKVAAVLQKSNTPFVFLTALYDKETIDRAKFYLPSAYLVKPFNKENLFATIELAINQQAHKLANNKLEMAPQFIKDGSKTISITPTEIIYLKVDGKYVYVYMQSERKHVIRIALKDLLARFHFPSLVQIHKSYAVNVMKITQVKFAEVYLEEVRIPLGRSFRDILLTCLNVQ